MLRAQGKNRLQSLLQMHGLRPPATDLLGAKVRCWLVEVVARYLPAATRDSVEQILPLDEVWRRELEIAEACLQALQPRYAEIRRLQTIPGLGTIPWRSSATLRKSNR